MRRRTAKAIAQAPLVPFALTYQSARAVAKLPGAVHRYGWRHNLRPLVMIVVVISVWTWRLLVITSRLLVKASRLIATGFREWIETTRR